MYKRWPPSTLGLFLTFVGASSCEVGSQHAWSSSPMLKVRQACKQAGAAGSGILLAGVEFGSGCAWAMARSSGVLVVSVLLVVVLCAVSVQPVSGTSKFPVPSYYVFGDSYHDAGNNDYLNGTLPRANFSPYGITFFKGVATGRFCDGRIIPDFLGEELISYSLIWEVNATYEEGFWISEVVCVLLASGRECNVGPFEGVSTSTPCCCQSPGPWICAPLQAIAQVESLISQCLPVRCSELTGFYPKLDKLWRSGSNFQVFKQVYSLLDSGISRLEEWVFRQKGDFSPIPRMYATKMRVLTLDIPKGHRKEAQDFDSEPV